MKKPYGPTGMKLFIAHPAHLAQGDISVVIRLIPLHINPLPGYELIKVYKGSFFILSQPEQGV